MASYTPTIIFDRNLEELKNRLSEEHSDKLCIVMFTAKWCRPCSGVKDKIYNKTTGEGLSKTLGDKVSFFYSDIDDNKTLADEFSITSIPHFFFMKPSHEDVEILCNFKGGSGLENKLKEYTEEDDKE